MRPARIGLPLRPIGQNLLASSGAPEAIVRRDECASPGLRRLDLELDPRFDMAAALRQSRHDEAAAQLVHQLGGNPGRQPQGVEADLAPLSARSSRSTLWK